MRALSPPICWQVRELINSSEGDGQYTARGGMINFELFESLMAKRVRDDDRESELKDAFRVLDKDGVGWISVAQMASICKVRALCHATRALTRSHALTLCMLSASRAARRCWARTSRRMRCERWCPRPSPTLMSAFTTTASSKLSSHSNSLSRRSRQELSQAQASVPLGQYSMVHFFASCIS